MPDVMDELSKSPRPLVADPADEEPRRSPVRFILLGMLLLAVLAGIWAYFHFRDRVSSDDAQVDAHRSEEHTSELQSLRHLVCRLLLEKKKKKKNKRMHSMHVHTGAHIEEWSEYA